jgi:hypothetical protein
MFASIRRYRLDAGAMDDLLHLIDTDFAESISEVDGFVAYEVLDCDGSEVVTMSIFRDEDSAQASDGMARDWVQANLSQQFDLTMLDTIHGEVAVSRAMEQMLEPAHH